MDWYRGNLTWLPSRTIFLTRHGSHAYGTNLPTSDLDLKGAAIAPREYYLGALDSFEQAETREPVDAVVYDIRKFFKLAWDCNPNIIEVLFTDESDWLNRTPEWLCILEHRQLFLSQKAKHTFSGYAVAQLKRIQTHRKWLLNPPKTKPERVDFGLPPHVTLIPKEEREAAEAMIRKRLDALGGEGLNMIEQESRFVGTALALGYNAGFIEAMVKERTFNSACRTWQQYQTWKTERNAVRSELEARFGYDTKHAMHLVRLLRMAKEILSDGQVLVKRPDAEELLSIRAGSWTYDELMEFASKAEAELTTIESPLPKSADRKTLNALLVETIDGSLL